MKKLLLVGCLLLIAACQQATQTPTPQLIPTATLPPTPIPVTDTPAPTPTIEPSPTPFPRFFTNGFDSSFAGWSLLQSNSDIASQATVKDGFLSVEITSPFTWIYSISDAHDYADVRIDAQFQNRAGSPASMGLICRYSEEKGWFEFNISTDGTYNVLYGKWLAVGIADYLPIADGPSKLIQPSGATQQIGLVCSDAILSLFINETILRNLDVTRYELAEGKVGITVSSFENVPVIAAFDWVTVSESPSP